MVWSTLDLDDSGILAMTCSRLYQSFAHALQGLKPDWAVKGRKPPRQARVQDSTTNVQAQTRRRFLIRAYRDSRTHVFCGGMACRPDRISVHKLRGEMEVICQQVSPSLTRKDDEPMCCPKEPCHTYPLMGFDNSPYHLTVMKVRSVMDIYRGTAQGLSVKDLAHTWVEAWMTFSDPAYKQHVSSVDGKIIHGELYLTSQMLFTSDPYNDFYTDQWHLCPHRCIRLEDLPILAGASTIHEDKLLKARYKVSPVSDKLSERCWHCGTIGLYHVDELPDGRTYFGLTTYRCLGAGTDPADSKWTLQTTPRNCPFTSATFMLREPDDEYRKLYESAEGSPSLSQLTNRNRELLCDRSLLASKKFDCRMIEKEVLNSEDEVLVLRDSKRWIERR